MNTKIRVRFAPSPTGALHIGGARTALYNYLWARKSGGTFILRIEDTDNERSTQQSALGITEGLDWLNIQWDEGPGIGGDKGPYEQSKRLPLYRQYLQKLLDEGRAYYCFCSEETLQQKREAARLQKFNYRYDRTCQQLSAEEVKHLQSSGLKPVIRLKVPDTGSTFVDDLIRGRVEFKNELLGDFIIAKADGWPTYNFAVVVDDALMEISHVIRAEEHLSNTPKQILIYQALGLSLPYFAHVSMILSPDHSKLSKRHGATSVQEFKKLGYLPEAIVNYIALLGWYPGEDADLLTLPELIQLFSLQNMTKAPAIYDLEKLTWMNGRYLQNQTDDALLEMAAAFDEEHQLQRDAVYAKKVISLIKSRCKLLTELISESAYFFTAPQQYDEQSVKKHFLNPEAPQLLRHALSIIDDSSPFRAYVIENHLRALAEKLGIKAGTLIHPIRLALSGRTNTPGIFEVMEVLGTEICQNRIKNALAYVQTRQTEIG